MRGCRGHNRPKVGGNSCGSGGLHAGHDGGGAGGICGRVERGVSPAAGAPGPPAGSPPRPAAPSRSGGEGGPSRAGPPPFCFRRGVRGGRPAAPRRPGPAPCGAPPPRPRPAPAPPPLRLGLGRGMAPGGEEAEPRRAGWDSLVALASPRVLPLAYYFLEDFQKKKKKVEVDFDWEKSRV